MRKLILVLFCLTGCASFPSLFSTLTPSGANKYELPFEFLCDGKMVFAQGLASCQYEEGATMDVRVKVPEGMDGQIQVRSCRHQRALDVDKTKSWQEFSWVQYAIEDSCPIEIAVATKDAGIQLGKIEPYVYNDKFPKMNAQGSVYCFSSEEVENIYGAVTCQVPTGIRVNGFLMVNPLKSGKYMIVISCGQNVGPKQFALESPNIPWSVTMNTVGSCPVSYVVEYDDGTEDEGLIGLEFFNNRYSILPPPVVKDNKVCAPNDYVAYDVDDKQSGNGFLSSRCKKFNSNSRAIAWDEFGRVSLWQAGILEKTQPEQ